MSAPVVAASRLARAFGDRRAVDDVSFELGRGECLALFGPNGAGKTTLLRVLGGLLRPTAGTAAVNGIALPGGVGARARLGVVSHATMLYDSLSGAENVTFFARLYGVKDPERAAREMLERLGAGRYADLPVRGLSRGMQQRVAIARAVVHGPSVLLADEPFSGLDSAGASALSGMLRALRDSGTTMIIVTHNLDEALDLCTQAAIMRGGRFARLDRAPLSDRAEYAALYRELAADAA